MVKARRVQYLTFTSAIGGLERCVINLSRELGARGWEVDPVFAEGPGSERQLAWCREQGVHARSSSALLGQTEHRGPAQIQALRRVVQRTRPSIVHIHDGTHRLSVKDVLAVRLAGFQRCVASIHISPAWTPEFERDRQRTRIASYFCDALIAHSDSVRQLLLEAGVPSRKIVRINYGIYPPLTSPPKEAARDRLGIPSSAFVVTTNSRLVEHKGPADVIDAVARIPDPDRNILLLIGGDGPMRPELEERAARLLPGRARFLGHLADHADLYAASDVFSMPSHDGRESFGLVFIEGAFHGVPSVGSSVGGIPEAIRDGVTGLIVPPHAPDDLARVLTRLRDEPGLRRGLGEAARTRAYGEFTAPLMADRYERAYLRMLKQAGPPRMRSGASEPPRSHIAAPALRSGSFARVGSDAERDVERKPA